MKHYVMTDSSLGSNRSHSEEIVSLSAFTPREKYTNHQLKRYPFILTWRIWQRSFFLQTSRRLSFNESVFVCTCVSVYIYIYMLLLCYIFSLPSYQMASNKKRSKYRIRQHRDNKNTDKMWKSRNNEDVVFPREEIECDRITFQYTKFQVDDLLTNLNISRRNNRKEFAEYIPETEIILKMLIK